MRQACTAMMSAGFLVLAVAFSGCGGDTGAAPGSGFLSEGPADEFKSTDITPLNPMIEQMKKNMLNKAYTQKPVPPKEKGDEKAK